MPKKKKLPRMFIYVEGGLIQTMASDIPMEVLVLDGDVDGIECPDNYKNIDGSEFRARVAWERKPYQSKSTVNHYFNEQARMDKENY